MSRVRALLAVSLAGNVVALGAASFYVASVGVGATLEKVGLRDPARVDYAALAEDRFGGLPGSELVILGDSQVQDGPFGEIVGEHARRGIGGATIDDVAAMVPASVGPEARQVFVIAGTNDAYVGRSEEQASEDASELVNAISEVAPDAEVLWLQVLAPADHAADGRAIDAGIRSASRAGEFRQVAVDGLSGSDGETLDGLTYDGTHLNAAGYAVIADDMREALGQVAG